MSLQRYSFLKNMRLKYFHVINFIIKSAIYRELFFSQNKNWLNWYFLYYQSDDKSIWVAINHKLEEEKFFRWLEPPGVWKSFVNKIKIKYSFWWYLSIIYWTKAQKIYFLCFFKILKLWKKLI